jgi:phage FluMu protein Com
VKPVTPTQGNVRLRCADCGGDFLFTAGEQQFYASRNLAAPKRCEDCRRVNRVKRADEDTNPGIGR